MVLSVFENIINKLILCKKCSFLCCINYEDSKSQTNIKDNRTYHDYEKDMYCYNESSINFERDYVLNTYPITADFYDVDDVGKFLSDIDGLCLHINKKGAEHIGEIRTKMKFTPLWAHNLCSDDVMNAIKEWQEALDNEKVLLYKERRIVDNKFVYMLVEAYPVFSKGRFKGMKGIMMRVTKPIWNRFDETKAKKLLITIEAEIEDSINIPVNISAKHAI